MLQLLYWAQEVAFPWATLPLEKGGKVEPAGDGGGTRCVEMELVFGGSFSAAEANFLRSGEEGRRLLVLSHLIPEMAADPSQWP